MSAITTSDPVASASSSPGHGSTAKTPAYSWLVLGMLTFVYTFNFLDRQLMAILTEPIRKEMGLSDRQMGMLGGIYFATFYTFLGVFVGYMADRTSRVRVLAIGSFLWCMFTMACGFSTSYPMLMASRMGVGVGEAAGSPPSYSIVSDYFPAHRRGMAIGIFSLGIPFGLAAGAAVGAKIAIAYGWRAAFQYIGAAGLVATICLIVLVKEPKRGGMDPNYVPTAKGERIGFVTTAKEFFGRATTLTTTLAAASVAFIGYGALNWTAPFLVRVKHTNMKDIALYYALELAICMGLGTWGAGQIADRLAKRAKQWYALVPLIAMTVAIPFYLGFLWAPTWQMSLAFLAVPTLLGNAYAAPAIAVIQNSVKPEQRTMASALFLLVLNFIGLGFGPTYVGEMSTRFTVEHGNVIGLQMAMYALTPFYGIAIILLLVEAHYLKKEGIKEKAAAAALLAEAAPAA